MGNAGDYSDQAATDILAYLNNRSYEVWRAHSWDFSLDPISVPVSQTTYEITFPGTTGELKDLGIQGSTNFLSRFSRRDYLRWQKQNNTKDAGELIGYIPLGRDASGNLKVRFFSAPAVAVTVEGWAKKRLTKLTTADLSLTTDLAYWPVEMHGLLYTFTLADTYKQMGDALWGATLSEAKGMLKELTGEVESEADLETKSPPPDVFRFRKRNRFTSNRFRGTRVV